MKRIEKISIIGMGALGIMYGQHLVKALGRDAVRFVADEERQRRYATKEIMYNGERCDFSMIAPSVQDDPADLLIFAVKSTGLAQAIVDAKNQVGEDTIIMSVLNGISSEEELMAVYGPDRILHCLGIGMDATKLGDELVAKNIGRVVFGTTDPMKVPLVEAVREFFVRVALPHVVADDIRYELWNKFMINVGVNQTVMIYEGNYRMIQEPGEPREQVKAAMREVIALAQAEGVALNESNMERALAMLDTLAPEGMPSMRQDGLLKRPSEVELFAGTVCRMAAKHGLAVPVNERFYQIITEREKEYR